MLNIFFVGTTPVKPSGIKKHLLEDYLRCAGPYINNHFGLATGILVQDNALGVFFLHK